MRRIPGMPIESQTAFRRHLIGQALAGLCTRDGLVSTPKMNAALAIATADSVIEMLSLPESNTPENKP